LCISTLVYNEIRGRGYSITSRESYWVSDVRGKVHIAEVEPHRLHATLVLQDEHSAGVGLMTTTTVVLDADRLPTHAEIARFVSDALESPAFLQFARTLEHPKGDRLSDDGPEEDFCGRFTDRIHPREPPDPWQPSPTWYHGGDSATEKN